MREEADLSRIDSRLLHRLRIGLDKSERQVYRLIERKVQETHLPPRLAAIALATENRINVTRFATSSDLAELRQVLSSQRPSAQTIQLGSSTVRVQPIRKRPVRARRRTGKKVLVVHGRDEQLRRSLFAFLRAIGLDPVEWRKALSLTRKGSPYIGEVLDKAFEAAAGIVVLLSPDDEARLKPELRKPTDDEFESKLVGQPRPNVLFEAGMSFARNPDSTVLVIVGNIRRVSDIGGRHVVHLSNSAESRSELVTKLRNAGCQVDDSGTDWLTEGDFVPVRSNTARTPNKGGA